MDEKEENKQQQTPEFSRDKERAVAAGVGAVVGGAAFAAATYSAGVWDESSHPEVISIETPNQTTTTADFDTNVTEMPILTGNDEVSIVSVENSEMPVEGFEYPSEGSILQSEIQEVMDLPTDPAMEIPSMDNLDCVCSDSEIITDDAHLHLI